MPDTVAIVRTPGTCSGRPRLEGTRVCVHDVVNRARAYNWDLERTRAEGLPHLTTEEIRTALAWYDTHREEVDAILSEQQADYEALKSGSGVPQ